MTGELSLIEAESLLNEANGLNPGPWVSHSRHVARAARCIAEKHPALDPERAYVFGLLHDIGRREGRTHLRHVVDGYRFLTDCGYPDCARISLTHSFVIPDLEAYVGEHDCPPQDILFLEDFLARAEFSEYDRLIVFCDGIALPSGICLMEKRFVDVAIRLGMNEKTIPSWRARFELQKHFEDVIGSSVYRIMPGVVEGTFGGGVPDNILSIEEIRR